MKILAGGVIALAALLLDVRPSLAGAPMGPYHSVNLSGAGFIAIGSATGGTHLALNNSSIYKEIVASYGGALKATDLDLIMHDVTLEIVVLNKKTHTSIGNISSGTGPTTVIALIGTSTKTQDMVHIVLQGYTLHVTLAPGVHHDGSFGFTIQATYQHGNTNLEKASATFSGGGNTGQYHYFLQGTVKTTGRTYML